MNTPPGAERESTAATPEQIVANSPIKKVRHHTTIHPFNISSFLVLWPILK